MGKLVKSLLLILVGIVVLFVLGLIVSFTYHQIQLGKEEATFIPTGQLVDVNGNDMHVHIEGEGKETLVFMAGGGISSPVLDFKTLADLLKDTYRVVIVEKAGYGFSDVTNSSRHIQQIYEETKAALEKARVEEPYILVPHSMSGVEAIYFAQNDPEKVKAIIGLDMAVPEVYENYPIPMPMIHLGSFAAKMGVHRMVPALSESDAVKYGNLSDEEKDLSHTILYRRTSTSNMVEEVKMIKENARIVEAGVVPAIPMLLLVSNGENTGMNKEEWVATQRQFSERQGNSQLLEVAAPHNIHNHKSLIVNEAIRNFVEELERD